MTDFITAVALVITAIASVLAAWRSARVAKVVTRVEHAVNGNFSKAVDARDVAERASAQALRTVEEAKSLAREADAKLAEAHKRIDELLDKG